MSDSSYYHFKELPEKKECGKNDIAFCFACIITIIIIIYLQ